MRYILSIAIYIAVVAGFMAWAATRKGPDDGVVAGFLLLALVALHAGVGIVMGRWWAVFLVVLLPLLAIPVPIASDCGEGCESLPMWFGMAFLGAPVGAVLIAMGIGARKLWDWRHRSEVMA